MSLVAKPAAFTAATLTPAMLNTLMDTIFDEFGTTTNGQGNITDINIASAAAIGRTKTADTAVVCGNTVGPGTQTITRPTTINTMGVPGTTATGYGSIILHVNTTAVGNVGAAGPDDLMSYAVPANVVVTTGRGLRVTAMGTIPASAGTKAVRLVWGSQTLLTSSTLNAVMTYRWRFTAWIIRTGLNTQDVFVELMVGSVGGMLVGVAANTTAGNFAASADFVAGTQTETAAITVKCQATASTADNDVVQEMFLVEAI